MNPQNDHNSKTNRDLIRGILIVPLQHLVFLIGWSILSAIIFALIPSLYKSYNSLLLIFPIGFIGISQSIYLIPTYFFFTKQQKQEVCKGIIISGIITILLNGSCAYLWGISAIGVYPIIVILVVVALFTFPIGLIANCLINRSR
jgi:hypothetical protein